jgi:hypothetical protein
MGGLDGPPNPPRSEAPGVAVAPLGFPQFPITIPPSTLIAWPVM